MNDYRVIVTGSRNWTDRATLVRHLEGAHSAALRAGRRLVVVHGDCPTGADARTRQWVNAMKRGGHVVEEERYPAQWREYGGEAGPIRNAVMIDEGADLVLAFTMDCEKEPCDPVPHISHGTFDTIRRAVAARIEVHQITPRPAVAR